VQGFICAKTKQTVAETDPAVRKGQGSTYVLNVQLKQDIVKFLAKCRRTWIFKDECKALCKASA
jgi:hypothetical protein